MIDLSTTIEPKSDQLNADDLIAGPRTIQVTSVSLLGEPDQPIAINFDGDKGKPYKPCKSMRRLLVALWGPDGAKYTGRSMTLYRDPTVKFGGAAVGGIRISHLSHISKPESIPLMVTRSVRKLFKVLPLSIDADPSPELDVVLRKIAAAETPDALKVAAAMASKLADQGDKAVARNAYVQRKAALEAPKQGPVAAILAGIAKHDPADLDVWLDEAREQGFSAEDLARVEAAIKERRA
jgi:hypothetical protein